MRLSKQRDTNQSSQPSYNHHNNNPHNFGNRNVNKHTNMHNHLVRCFHSASSPKPLESLESRRVRTRFALKQENDGECEAKRRACVKAMTRLRARLRASNEAEDDTDSSMTDSNIQLSQPEYTTFPFTTQDVHFIKAKDSPEKKTSLDVRVHPAVASPGTRRQYTTLKLIVRQGLHFSGSDKARVRIRKTPIAVRFRPSLCRSNNIPLKTELCRPGHTIIASQKLLNLDSYLFHGNVPASSSIVTAEIATAQPRSQESVASKSHHGFTFVDLFIFAMFVLQYLIWITLLCLFVSVL